MPLFHSATRRARQLLTCSGLILASLFGMSDASDAQDDHTAQRKAMLDEIARTAFETRAETGRAAFSERVMAALARVERHRLVAVGDEAYAYLNRPLSIGHGQTISQPFIVALMTDLMDVQPGDRVLEVGTGSGYQAAVLAALGARVYTVEILESLGRLAAERLAALGYRNIQMRIGDGYLGWPEHAPFDAIIVTAAAREAPQPLLEQLKPGGRLVIPVGTPLGVQTLYLIEKRPDGRLEQREILDVRFVPLTRSPSK